MTHSLLFPFLVLNLVNVLFYNIILLVVARKLSHFCKMARRSTAVDHTVLIELQFLYYLIKMQQKIVWCVSERSKVIKSCKAIKIASPLCCSEVKVQSVALIFLARSTVVIRRN